MTTPKVQDSMFPKVAIIGIGLIGGSLAWAMRDRKLAQAIVGYDRDPEAAAQATSLGVVDRATESLDAAVADADLVIVSTPVGAAGATIVAAAQAAKPDALIIDVGSVKGEIVNAAAQLPNEPCVVPCHPIAGTERSGPAAGFASLFQDRWCIMTPLDRQDAPYTAAVDRAMALWRAVGSDVEIMSADHHDIALAVTSHLPHLIAFTLVGAADDLETVTEAEIVKYSAGGFRDFTRIAASDPVMWRDVFLNNKGAVLEVLGRFTEELALLQRAIRWGDADTLEQIFARGRSLRRAIVEAGQEKDVANFGRNED